MYIEKRIYIVLLRIYGKMNYSSFLPFDIKCKIISLSANPGTDVVHRQYSLNKTNKRILVSCLIDTYPYFICSFKKYNRAHTFLISTYNKKYLIKFIPRSMYNASEFLWALSIFAIQHRKFNNKLKGELGILMAFHSACPVSVLHRTNNTQNFFLMSDLHSTEHYQSTTISQYSRMFRYK